MDCPRCGAHNETEVGSCLSCGASMSEDESLPTIAQKPTAAAPGKGGSPRLAQGAPPKQCPSCMTLNAATFKFCARCGTPLGATAAPAAQQTPAPVAPPEKKPAKAAAPAPPPKPAAPKQPTVPPLAAKPPPITATKPPQARPAPPPPPKPVTGISK